MKKLITILSITLAIAFCAVGSVFITNLFEAPSWVAVSLFIGGVISSVFLGKYSDMIMAVGLVNVGELTFNGKEVRDIAEAIWEETYENPEITLFHTIVQEIVAKEQIAYLGRLDKVTKADAGCGSGKTTKNIPLSEKFWDPAKTKIWIQQCADELENSFFVYAQQKGIDRKDLTTTDFADFVMQRLAEAIKEDILRIVWFNDVDAANVSDSPAGVITDGVDLADYNIIDGFWKQIYDIVAADSTRRVTIARNAEATYVDQAFTDTDTTNKVAETILQNLKYNADYRLRNKSNLVIIATQSLVDQYAKELRSRNIDASFVRIEGGYTSLKFEGIDIIGFNFWDRTIRADFDNGASYYQPHRAVLTTKEQLMVGLDSKASVTNLKNYYDDETEYNNWKGGYKIDAKIREDHMIQVAY